MPETNKEHRIVAVNMQQAMRKLTEQLGADAVLLSSRKIDRGVEIIGLPAGVNLSEYQSRQTNNASKPYNAQLGSRAALERSISESIAQGNPATDTQSGSLSSDHKKLAEASLEALSANDIAKLLNTELPEPKESSDHHLSQNTEAGKTETGKIGQSREALSASLSKLKSRYAGILGDMVSKDSSAQEQADVSEKNTRSETVNVSEGHSQQPSFREPDLTEDYFYKPESKNVSANPLAQASSDRRSDDNAVMKEAIDTLTRQVDKLSMILAEKEQQAKESKKISLDNEDNTTRKEALDVFFKQNASTSKSANFVVINRLQQMGLEESVAKALVYTSEVNAENSNKPSKTSSDSLSAKIESLWKRSLKQLSAILPLNKQNIFEAGGIFCFVGPAGSGKTSVLAMVLAQYILQGKAEDIAVIQHAHSAPLSRLVKGFGIPLFEVTQQQPLTEVLSLTNQYRTVLIDTWSLDEKDSHADSYLKAVRGTNQPIKEVITMPAMADINYMQQVISDYKSPQTIGCLLTFYQKIESLGGVISLLLLEQLNIVMVSDGVVLPQHLFLPEKKQLIDRMLYMMDCSVLDEAADLLANPLLGANKPVNTKQTDTKNVSEGSTSTPEKKLTGDIKDELEETDDLNYHIDQPDPKYSKKIPSNDKQDLKVEDYGDSHWDIFEDDVSKDMTEHNT